jgi:diaminopimelate decarboxylase
MIVSKFGGTSVQNSDAIKQVFSIVASRKEKTFLDAGAYGFSMASNYNGRPLPAEVLVDGITAIEIRRRQTFEDYISLINYRKLV